MTKKQLFLIDYADTLSDVFNETGEINTEHFIYKKIKESVEEGYETSIAIGSHVQSNVFELARRPTNKRGRDKTLLWMNPDHYQKLATATGATFNPLLMNDILQAQDPEQFVPGSTLADHEQRKHIEEQRQKKTQQEHDETYDNKVREAREEVEKAEAEVRKAEEEYRPSRENFENLKEMRQIWWRAQDRLNEIENETVEYPYNVVCPLFVSKIPLIYTHVHHLAKQSSREEDEITVSFIGRIQDAKEAKYDLEGNHNGLDLLPYNVKLDFYFKNKDSEYERINKERRLFSATCHRCLNPQYATGAKAATLYHREQQEERRERIRQKKQERCENDKPHLEYITHEGDGCSPDDHEDDVIYSDIEEASVSFNFDPEKKYAILLNQSPTSHPLLPKKTRSESEMIVPVNTSVTFPSTKTTVGGIVGAGLVSFGISALLHSVGMSSFGMGAGTIGGGVFSAATLGWGALAIGVVLLIYVIYRSYQNHKARENYQFISTDASVNNTSSQNQNVALIE